MRLPLLILHVSAGILAMLAGALAISFRKGSRGHRVAGSVFVISMLSVSSAGAWLAFRKSEADNVLGGIFTFYLIATAWATTRHGEAKIWKLDWIAPPAALAIAALWFVWGVEVTRGRMAVGQGSSAGGVLLLRCPGPVMRGRGYAHAAARRDIRETTPYATSLAHVLWVVYRYDLLLSWSAAGISPLVAGINRACDISVFAIALYDFLACPDSLYKHLPKRMGTKWPGTITGHRSDGTPEAPEYERDCDQLLKA
jgi:uncharacterized membrane protein